MRGLIAEVVLAAADTFHEMLAAYRNNAAARPGSALREHIQSLLTTSPAAALKVRTATPIRVDRIRTAADPEAFRRGELSITLRCISTAEALLPRPHSNWSRKALEGAGKVLALHPEAAASIGESV